MLSSVTALIASNVKLIIMSAHVQVLFVDNKKSDKIDSISTQQGVGRGGHKSL